MVPLPGLPDACRPRSLADGYAIQAAFIDAFGVPVSGWKIGCTSEVAQRMLGVEEPFFGPVFAPAILTSPATTRAADFHMTALECEFAFRLGHALPASGGPYDRDRVIRAIDAVIPAIEIISTRFEAFATAGGPQIVADCGANGALVLGEPDPDWEDLELDSHPVALAIDDRPQAEGSGSAVLGHPLNAMIWFVNHFIEQAGDLAAGLVVSTGTCTGLTPIVAGQSARADFGNLGEVRLHLAN
jgi:2-oxo-3-hexenedioate decarboxylase